MPTSLRDGVGPLPHYVSAFLRNELRAGVNLGELARVFTGSASPTQFKSEASQIYLAPANVEKSPRLGFLEWLDRARERRAALRMLRNSGYVVRSDEIYYPNDIKINGKVVERKEEIVGRLMFDGIYNRAKILWEHHHKLERKLRSIGYVSAAPVDKV
ncbi:hypothetical protein HYX08_03315 [Candidatus Woesearchaeota archaeon]|nr:hypothetical protein [Candidatus Woesearchaeota archaeon]